jgi:hypothetical protein
LKLQDRVTASLPNYKINLPLAALVPGQSLITAMCFDVGGLDVVAEMAIDPGPPFAFARRSCGQSSNQRLFIDASLTRARRELDIYDWKDLGRTPGLPARGCAGFYVTPARAVPANATRAVKSSIIIPTSDRLDAFASFD